MFKKIRKKIKNFLSPIFKPESPERGAVITLVVVGVVAAIAGIAGTVAWMASGDSLISFLGKVGISVASSIVYAIYIITRHLVNLSAGILEKVLASAFITAPITKDGLVLHGWRIVRDLANMFIVLGFVVVGIATALRIKEYQAQRKLLPLICIALLINFSPLICGVMIDAANITINYFIAEQGAGAGIVTGSIRNLLESETKVKEKFDKFKEANEFGEFLTLATGLIFFNIIAAIIFFIFCFLFLFRQVALMCLVVLSPLAFVCWIFDATKKIWNMWWDNFLKWLIMGLPAAFFLYLASLMLSGKIDSQIMAAASGLSFLLPAAFLYIGYRLSVKTGALGAGAAVKLAGATAAVASGAGLWAAKKAWGGTKKTGAAVGRTKTASRIGERIGLTKSGTFAQQRAKAREEAKKRTDADYVENPDRVRRMAEKRRDRYGAAALATAAEHGKFDRTRHEHLVDRAEKFGWERKIFENVDPNIVKGDKDRLVDLKKQGLSQTTAEQQAKREAIEKKVRGMTPTEYRKMNPNAITPAVLSAGTPRFVQRTGAAGRPELVDEFKKYKPKFDASGKALPRNQQTKEFTDWYDYVRNNYPSGSSERKNAAEIVKILTTDKNFS